MLQSAYTEDQVLVGVGLSWAHLILISLCCVLRLVILSKTVTCHTVLGLSVMERHLGELLRGGVNSLFRLVSSHPGLLNASILSHMF